MALKDNAAGNKWIAFCRRVCAPCGPAGIRRAFGEAHEPRIEGLVVAFRKNAPINKGDTFCRRVWTSPSFWYPGTPPMRPSSSEGLNCDGVGGRRVRYEKQSNVSPRV